MSLIKQKIGGQLYLIIDPRMKKPKRTNPRKVIDLKCSDTRIKSSPFVLFLYFIASIYSGFVLQWFLLLGFVLIGVTLLGFVLLVVAL